MDCDLKSVRAEPAPETTRTYNCVYCYYLGLLCPHRNGGQVGNSSEHLLYVAVGADPAELLPRLLLPAPLRPRRHESQVQPPVLRPPHPALEGRPAVVAWWAHQPTASPPVSHSLSPTNPALPFGHLAPFHYLEHIKSIKFKLVKIIWCE